MENNQIEWENIVSINQAAKLFNRSSKTIVRNIWNGVFTEGIDCKKYGGVWVMDIRRLREIYGNEKKEG